MNSIEFSWHSGVAKGQKGTLSCYVCTFTFVFMAFVFGCQLFRRDERRQGRPSLRRTRPPVASYVRSQYRVNPFSTRNFDRIYIHYDARCLYLPRVLHVLGPSSWRMLVVRSSTPRPSLFVNVLAHALQAGFVPGFLEQGECTACEYFTVRRDARWRPCVPIRLCGWVSVRPSAIMHNGVHIA